MRKWRISGGISRSHKSAPDTLNIHRFAKGKSENLMEGFVEKWRLSTPELGDLRRLEEIPARDPSRSEVVILHGHEMEYPRCGQKLQLTIRILGDVPSYKELATLAGKKGKVRGKFQFVKFKEAIFTSHSGKQEIISGVAMGNLIH